MKFLPNLKLAASVFVLSLGISHYSLAESRFSWPNNAKAAVNLSYDDALASSWI